MRDSDAKRLAGYEARLRELATKLSHVGFVSQGSVVRRYVRCGKPDCRCASDPEQLHGPYWQWSTAIDGKTVSRRLTDRQARVYREWIANRRRAERILHQMEALSHRAAEILLSNETGSRSRS